MSSTTTTKEKQETLFDVADDEGVSVELIPAEQAMAPLRAAGQPIMMQIAQMPQGEQIIERAIQTLITVRKAAIRLTGPTDWVAMKAKGASDDAAFCLLTSSGALKVKKFFMIQVDPAQPTDGQGAFAPRIERGEDGEVMLHAWTTARSLMTGESVRVSGSRSSSEDFTGRTQAIGASALTERADLARSVETLLTRKAVEQLSGMKKVSILELADLGMKTELIPRGQGFGSSSDRGASAVAPEAVKTMAKELGDEIMRRTGGDKSAAADLLKEITANPPKFGGFNSISRLTQDWQITNARKKLAEHPVFGDKAQGGNGGDS